MFAQLILSLILFTIYYIGNLNIWIFGFATLMTIYWLPKWLIIYPVNYIFPNVVFRRIRKNKTVYLTFDDVPNGDTTEKIVKLLNKYNTEGTFFVISDYINAKNKQTLINAIKSGHQLCNHGKTNSAHALKSLENLQTEITNCQERIDDLYELAKVEKPKNKFYRPGCGLFNSHILRFCKNNNFRLALGSVYPNDTISIVPWINYWYLRMHIEDGDVIIMHDRLWTPKTLEYLLDYMKRNNIVSKKLDYID